ncbi:MAG TPA: alanine racemase [Candidatus Paceibacterota bacterium]|nr:alanine racemase [Candidatus Paceibacterota bacterium]
MRILERFRTLERRLSGYAPLVEVSISRANLLHNLRMYQERHPGVRIAPVLKSNAYGHDLGLIARLLDTEDIAFFMVDSLYEAHRLRQAGIRSRVVVMGYVRPRDMARSRLAHVDFALTDREQLAELLPLLTHDVRLHVKVDTGMHRQGITRAHLPRALEALKKSPHAKVVGIATHLADADSEDEAFSRTQLAAWMETLALVEAAYPALEFRHIAATKGVRFSAECRANVARVGIGLYGFDTAPGGKSAVKPVLELRSLVTSIRDIPAGDAVGYNATFIAGQPSRIATVPVGYYEGIDRRLSSAGSMRIREEDCPIAGRVSMNMTTLDITGAGGVAQGDRVIAISRTPEHPNSVANIAERIGTIPYEVLVHVPPHLRRVVE